MLKAGILLCNLGGPDSLDAVEPFLYNLFRDPDIIKLPLSTIFQKPLAWWISSQRAPDVKKLYDGIGGRSPIVPLTEAQADALVKTLQDWGYPDIKAYIAMRYWHPFTEEALQQIKQDGVDTLIVLPLYPQFSYTSTASSTNELERQLDKIYASSSKLKPSLHTIFQFYQHPDYLEALANTIRDGLENNPWACSQDEVQIVFSAHSLPLRHVKRTGDPYPEQTRETAKTVMERYFPNNEWELAYQSKVGRMAWLGPTTDGVLHYFAAYERDNVLLVPISFVSDHLETLSEIDKEYIPLAHEIGYQHCYRARALNNEPKFIECLAKLVQQKLEAAKIPHLELVAN